jgi:hypothetical protein
LLAVVLAVLKEVTVAVAAAVVVVAFDQVHLLFRPATVL